LFIDGNGEVVYRSTGYFEVPEFLKIAKDAVDPSKKLSYLKEKFNAGTNDPVVLKSIINAFAFSDKDLAPKQLKNILLLKKAKIWKRRFPDVVWFYKKYTITIV
jgi:ABC-type uncharacterized transport system permease subunit